jgi:hypothetical protein
MPVTPFHFGIGVLAKGCGSRHFSLIGFCTAQVVLDLESGYFLCCGGWPLHRWLHTLIGASLVCTTVAVVGGWFGSRRRAPSGNAPAAARLVHDDLAALRTSLGLVITVALAALGHLIPDAIMHEDVRVLAPLSDWNPFFASASLSTLHVVLVTSGVLGGAIILARSARRRGSRG